MHNFEGKEVGLAKIELDNALTHLRVALRRLADTRHFATLGPHLVRATEHVEKAIEEIGG